MILFTLLHPEMTEDILGWIPAFFHPDDKRAARDQINVAYRHGGGWRPMDKWVFSPSDHSITYPGDPKLLPLAEASLRDEKIYLYRHAWLCIVQPDGSYEVARVD